MTDTGRLCPSCQTPIPGDQRVCPSCGAISLPGARGSLGETVAARLRTALGNRYRIEREIGEGGMAVVYLAHDLRHDRPVALKVLRPGLAAYLGAERFLREIHFEAQLNHPHILALHDSGEADGLLYYVMPYVEGESLRQRLVREGPLPVAEAVALGAEVADGLAYAHELGVVHRDIKPENVLLSHGHAAIADFGIARAVAGAGPTITATGFSPGTPVYMSPEQAAGDAALDHRADIYSLGCVLYEMLTGKPPFPGPTAPAYLTQHAMSPPPSARAARGEVPPALDAAVRRAIAKAPAERFQTAAEFRAVLLGASAASSALTGHAGILSGWKRRGIAAVVVMAAAVFAVLLLPRRPGRAPAPPAPIRVVVQPFEDRTGRLGDLARRVSEVLTQRLQQVPALGVIAYPMVMQSRWQSLDSLRARFAPDRFVVGHVSRDAKGLRLGLQVLDARTGSDLGDSSAVVPRESAAADAAEALGVFARHVFWDDLDQRDRRARVTDDEAWRLVQEARDRRSEALSYMETRLYGQGLRSFDLADSLLRLAGQRDRNSDLIPVDLAALAELRSFYLEFLRQVDPAKYASLPSPADERLRAVRTLDGLIRMRRGPADALELRGRIRLGLYRQFSTDSLLVGATQDLRAATDLDPHMSRAWNELGSANLAAGANDDALWATQQALAGDVFLVYRDQVLRTEFDAALRAGRFDVAEQACRTGAAEYPLSTAFADCDLQLWAHTRSDRRSAAGAAAKADSLAPRETNPLALRLRALWIADILARAQLGDSADRVARRATADVPRIWRPFLWIEEAYFRTLRSDPDSAIRLIGSAVRLDATYRRIAGSLPWFAPLRGDPRFLAAVGEPKASS